MRTEQADGVAVVSWRPPALGCADVLRDIDASLDGCDERVLDAAQPDGIAAAVLASVRLLAEDGSVVRDAPQ